VPRRCAAALAVALSMTLALLPAHAGADQDDGVTKTDNVTQVAHFPYIGGAEVDFDVSVTCSPRRPRSRRTCGGSPT
jgi:hypothetical protein